MKITQEFIVCLVMLTINALLLVEVFPFLDTFDENQHREILLFLSSVGNMSVWTWIATDIFIKNRKSP